MDVCRRHKTPGSETKDFITSSNGRRRVSAFTLAPVPRVPISTGQCEEVQVAPAHTAVYFTEEEL